MNQTLATVSTKNDIAEKISVLEKGIINQEDQIFLTSTELIPVLDLKDQCSNLTEADKARLIQKCQTTI